MRRSLALLFMICLAAGAAGAQTAAPQPTTAEQQALDEYIKLVKGDLEARRDSAISAVLELNDAQRKAFEPLKKAYDKERAEIGKRRLAAVQDYKKVHTQLTAEKARELFERTEQLDADRMALRKKYFDLMAKEVSPVVAVQFVQLERQFETMGDLKLATQVPLATQ